MDDHVLCLSKIKSGHFRVLLCLWSLFEVESCRGMFPLVNFRYLFRTYSEVPSTVIILCELTDVVISYTQVGVSTTMTLAARNGYQIVYDRDISVVESLNFRNVLPLRIFTALDPGWSGPGFSPCLDHCVVFLRKITFPSVPFSSLARVVRKVDNAIRRVSHYSADSVICFF